LTINPDIIGYSFLVFTLFYFAVLVGVYVGLKRLAIPQQKTEHTISVIVAARNEENRIQPCLTSLANLDYPTEKHEVIFVDDLSEDSTADIIKKYCDQHPNWHLIRITEFSKILHGKKNALLHGIAKSKGDIIFTTDADCAVPPGWLKEMGKYFQPGVSMVLGYSPLKKGTGFFRKILEFDNLFSAVSAAAPTKLGYPLTSIGRNLAYRKDAYENAGGFLALKKFRSGDDVHMTERFRYLNTGIIDFSIHPDTFVETIPPDSKSEIFHQQIRKNSKVLKKSPSSIIFSAALFLYYLVFAAIPLFYSDWLNVWLILFVGKFLGEFICLSKAAKIFRQNKIIKHIPIMQVIFPAYIIFFSILGVFQLYRWKR